MFAVSAVGAQKMQCAKCAELQRVCATAKCVQNCCTADIHIQNKIRRAIRYSGFFIFAAYSYFGRTFDSEKSSISRVRFGL